MSEQGRFASWFDGELTHEAMFAVAPDGSEMAELVTEWSFDSTGLIYTFKLQPGVPWHSRYGDWGTFNADDLIFSLEEVGSESSIHSSSGGIRQVYLCDGCILEKVDDLTVRLTRPTPSFEITWYSRNPVGQTTQMHSKKHYDTVGRETANHQSVGTGPWELTAVKDEVSKEATAVMDHWRKTPEWARTIWWDIDEETTRLANFQAGLLDTGTFGMDSIQAIQSKSDPDIKFMSFNSAYWLHLDFTGQYYYNDHPSHLPKADGGKAAVPVGDGSFDCTVAYVSCDSDTTSVEWDKALKVRQAMNISVDRESIANNVFSGSAEPIYISWWMGHDARLKEFGLDKLKWEYDPVRARQLLDEAGYDTGPTIPMVIREGFLPGNNEVAEAVAGMMLDAGFDVEISRMPHSAFRPNLIRRTGHQLYSNGDSPNVEPYRSYRSITPLGGYNYGWEHPDLFALIAAAGEEFDPEKRWPKLAQVARWNFDNAMHMPTVEVGSVWPLGPDLDPWEPMGGNRQWLSYWEYAPHREN
jgi:peptide/nickel transport system substrate-binding protein